MDYKVLRICTHDLTQWFVFRIDFVFSELILRFENWFAFSRVDLCFQEVISVLKTDLIVCVHDLKSCRTPRRLAMRDYVVVFITELLERNRTKLAKAIRKIVV